MDYMVKTAKKASCGKQKRPSVSIFTTETEDPYINLFASNHNIFNFFH